MLDHVKLREWAQRYIAVMGAPSQDEEEATDVQSALRHRVYDLKQTPYVDFGVWLPFGRRVQKNQKFRAFMLVGDGPFVMKELPGPNGWLVGEFTKQPASLCKSQLWLHHGYTRRSLRSYIII